MKIAEKAIQKNPHAKLFNMLKMTREALKHRPPTWTSAAPKENTDLSPLAELSRQKKSKVAGGSEVVVISVPCPSRNNRTYTPSEAIAHIENAFTNIENLCKLDNGNRQRSFITAYKQAMIEAVGML